MVLFAVWWSRPIASHPVEPILVKEVTGALQKMYFVRGLQCSHALNFVVILVTRTFSSKFYLFKYVKNKLIEVRFHELDPVQLMKLCRTEFSS